MLNGLKLALLSFGKNAIIYVLITLELSALFFVGNYVICAMEEREMLNAPYEEILESDCLYVFDNEYLSLLIASDISKRESRNRLLSGIKGDYEVYDIMTYTNGSLCVVSLSDELYSNLKLPLTSGKYRSDHKSAIGSYDMELGMQSFSIMDNELELDICGILTDVTYLPSMNYYGTDMTTKNFYDAADQLKHTVITNRSSILGFEDEFINSMGFFIKYNGLSDADTSVFQEKALTISAENIIENTNAEISQDKKSFYPLFLIAALIVVVGIISVSLIAFKENECRNGILWICGFTRVQILLAHMIQVCILPVLSIGIAFLSYWALCIMGSEITMCVYLTCENLIFTLVMLALIVASAMIIPIVKSGRVSPIQYIRRVS